jgi:hypothetical protein
VISPASVFFSPEATQLSALLLMLALAPVWGVPREDLAR